MEEKEANFSTCLPDFDCNICLSFAVDPIITLCGHLYCWPCIYRWLDLNSAESQSESPASNCPVCKSPFSESTLIPLYGRGLNADSNRQSDGIPDRPTEHRKLVAASANVAADRRPVLRRRRIYPVYDDGEGRSMGILHSTAGAVLSEMVLGLYDSPEMAAGGRRGRRSARELRVESWLHQLWCFLCCCGLLCLLFF